MVWDERLDRDMNWVMRTQETVMIPILRRVFHAEEVISNNRIRKLLHIRQKNTEPTPAPIKWKTAEQAGPKGDYQWITPRQNPELATRLKKGHLISEGYRYWLAEAVGVIMRRKL